MTELVKKMPVHLLLIVIVGLFAYSNTFSVPFQFDDIWNIVENPLIKDLGSFTSSLRAYEYNPRRYVGYLTLALNYRFGGLDVTGYHIVNLLIHIVNGLLVYFLVLLTFRTPYFNNQRSAISNQQSADGNNRFIALFSGLLFVSHPVQTQAVTYIVQRFTSLATMWYLLSVVMYIKGRQEAIGKGQGVTPLSPPLARGEVKGGVSPITYRLLPVAYYLLSLLFAVLAMKTKEIAFTLPLIIAAYEFIFIGSSIKRKLLFLLPVLLTLVIIPVSIIGADRPLGQLLSDLSDRTRVDTNIPRCDYLMTQMRVVVTYLRLIVLPVDQNLDYDYPVYRSFFTPPVLLSFLLLAALFGAAAWLLYRSRQFAVSGQHSAFSNDSTTQQLNGLSFHRSRVPGPQSPFTFHDSRLPIHDSRFALYRLTAFGILWFFITLSVESSVIPIADVIFEHRIYLPSVGFFIAVVAGVTLVLVRYSRLPFHDPRIITSSTPMRIALCVMLVLVLGLASATYARNLVWGDSLTLWRDVAAKSPDKSRVQNDLGYAYYERGMVTEATGHFVKALRLRPGNIDARINLGIVYNAQEMYDAAILQFQTALRINPDDPDAHNNLGISYVSKGLIDQAITHYQAALRLRPDYPEAHNNLGVAYGSMGIFDQAIAQFNDAVRLKPDYFEPIFNLGLLYLRMNDRSNAYKEYMRLSAINPEGAARLLVVIQNHAE